MRASPVVGFSIKTMGVFSMVACPRIKSVGLFEGGVV